jgi:Polyketide cyclase / dehydrase and lipid transport
MSKVPADERQKRRFGNVNTALATIAVAPDELYAVLLDRSKWVEGFDRKIPVDGPTDAPGERARYRTAAGERLEEVLVAIRPHRYVTRLADLDDTETHAFAEWRITAAGVGSTIEFNLYWLDSAPAAIPWANAKALRAGYHAHTQSLLEGHLARIKDVAESLADDKPLTERQHKDPAR